MDIPGGESRDRGHHGPKEGVHDLLLASSVLDEVGEEDDIDELVMMVVKTICVAWFKVG